MPGYAMSAAGLLLIFAVAAADPASLLRDAHKLYGELEYDRVVPIAEQILQIKDTTIQQKLDAYLLKGSCLAILGQTLEAEKTFRLLLRIEPSFDVKASVSPKILSVLRKVQHEERVLAEQLQALERQRIIAQLAINGLPADRATGGEPILFEIEVNDPSGAVSAVSLRYRRIIENAYSSLALQRDDRGLWVSKIPAEWTANDGGFQMEYFISTADLKGRELITSGTAESPHRIEISSGDIPGDPFYTSTWFWLGTAALVAGASVGGFFIFRDNAGPPTDLGTIPVN
jgi:hypothetical protein